MDIYIDMQTFVQSSRVYSSLRSEDNLSTHRLIALGTKALYSTLTNGQSFKFPIEKTGSLRIDLTVNTKVQNIAVGLLSEPGIQRHVRLFTSVRMLNGVVAFARGDTVSVFNLSQRTWSHQTPAKSPQSFPNLDHCLFGPSRHDIQELQIVSVNAN